jgi:predicted NAD-dependent protein-ADP-ribosyltransferase YbiA (DUF1768 family)
MELHSAEAESLKKNIAAWLESPDQELEATFGVGGRVDVTTFLTVAKRLRARGFVSLPQEDRLTITLPDHLRFALMGPGIIQDYCRDDVLAGKPFVAMIKDRTVAVANTDLVDYDVRVKLRREIGLAKEDAKVQAILKTWEVQRKAFRLMRRWSFEGEGLVIDMSIVRGTSSDTAGNYRWQKLFRDQNIAGSVPFYEIEVELKRLENDTVETALKRLFKGMGEILRGIQKHTFLIRKSTRDKVLRGYKDLVGTDKFRGVAPITMEMPNFIPEEGTPNIRTGYNVTDKADGLRVMAYCDDKGELFMIDMGFNVYKTGLTNVACRKSLLDGEWVTQTSESKAISQLLLFDMYINLEKSDVTKKPFYKEGQADTRYELMRRWQTIWTEGVSAEKGITAATRLQIAVKNFLFATPGDLSIFRAASRILDMKTIYNTDGLIFTPNETPLPEKAGTGFESQFKWKPAHDNTVDFLVTIEKFTDSVEDRITTAAKEDTGETITYKTLRLLVGSSVDPALANPREVILGELPVNTARNTYRPAAFNPKEFPDTMASICYRKIENSGEEEFIMTDKTQEPIQDKCILECAYDPSQPPGWRWKPLRVRMDKTERLQKGILSRTLNSDKTAEGVWNSIHDPITESMIRTGNAEPTDTEVAALSKEMESRQGVARRYYERKAPTQDLMLVSGLRDFHNKYIKQRILLPTGLRGGSKTLLDLAVGKAADLQKWRFADVGFVLGVDYAGENITGADNGAYRRYFDTVSRAGRNKVPPMIFAIADSSKPLVDGTAGATEQEKDILRSVFGRVRPSAPVPPFVEREGAGRLKNGADCVSVMFALHYFFETQDTFNGFLKNVNEGLKIGGYFIGCCFDGKAVFDLLRGVEKGKSKSGLEGEALLWTITKQYQEDTLPEDETGFGLGIDVEFISIGTSHREYLVPFKLLQDRMSSIGCELLTDAELKEVGLKHSTALFSESYDMARASGKKFAMSDIIKKFSFLNRWFIFKRKDGGKPSEANSEVLPAVAAPVETPSRIEAAFTPKTKKAIRLVSALPVAATVAPEAAVATALPPAPTDIEPVRTIAVQAATAAPQKRSYAIGEVFQFYARAALQDKLKIGDKGAGRWLSPSAPFPIADPEDAGISYPTVDHFLSAMLYKKATNKPEVAVTLLSREGSIHQEYIRQRQAEAQPLPEDRDFELLEQENKDVKAAIRPTTLKKYKATFDEVKWATIKDDLLRTALRYRWEKDARFRKIVEAARNQGKMLLYYTPGATTNVGGVRRDDGTIEGDNKIGRIIMELGNFTA